MTFVQEPPQLGNQYDEDRVLRSFLRRTLPTEVLSEIEPQLREKVARGALEAVLDGLRDGAEIEIVSESIEPSGQAAANPAPAQ